MDLCGFVTGCTYFQCAVGIWNLTVLGNDVLVSGILLGKVWIRGSRNQGS